MDAVSALSSDDVARFRGLRIDVNEVRSCRKDKGKTMNTTLLVCEIAVVIALVWAAVKWWYVTLGICVLVVIGLWVNALVKAEAERRREEAEAERRREEAKRRFEEEEEEAERRREYFGAVEKLRMSREEIDNSRGWMEPDIWHFAEKNFPDACNEIKRLNESIKKGRRLPPWQYKKVVSDRANLIRMIKEEYRGSH